MLIWKGACSWDWGCEGGWGGGRRCCPSKGSREAEGGECCIETMATFVAPPARVVVEDVWRWSESRLGEVWLHREARTPEFEDAFDEGAESWWGGQVGVLVEDEGSARGEGHRRWTFDLSKDWDERWSTCVTEERTPSFFPHLSPTLGPVYALQEK